MTIIQLPSPDLQIGFAVLLAQADSVFLQKALMTTVAGLPLAQIDAELHALVPGGALAKLAAAGLRGELVFPVPTVLRANPSLLGYYRLLCGFSQKEFYLAKHGVAAFKAMEESGSVTPKCAARIDELCAAFALVGAGLAEGISADRLGATLLDRLSLLTLGSQFRGSANVARGNAAIRVVFALIEELTLNAITAKTATRIEIKNAARRRVRVEFAADPDIAISEEISQGDFANKIAIEIKGGTDFSNIHNRVGEAEKRHQKARRLGFTEFWTIVNVEGFDEATAARESPTTNRFYSLADLRTRKGKAFLDFRSRLESLLGIRRRAKK